MSVSKRLRYEILRRDNHTCRYCGATAPDVPLTVDHVLPVALGGSDDPDNLVAACRDCNAGKTSSNPDQPLVTQVSDDAIRWARAVARAVEEAQDNFAAVTDARDQFITAWNEWTDREGRPLPVDANWPDTVDRMMARGLPIDLIVESVRVAMARTNIRRTERYTYFCGVAWKKIRTIDEQAKQSYDRDTPTVCGDCDEEFPFYDFATEIVRDIAVQLTSDPQERQLAASLFDHGLPAAASAYDDAIRSGHCCKARTFANLQYMMIVDQYIEGFNQLRSTKGAL